eukprot:1161167-Pelagomonas_calceolata.AAC.6
MTNHYPNKCVPLTALRSSLRLSFHSILHHHLQPGMYKPSAPWTDAKPLGGNSICKMEFARRIPYPRAGLQGQNSKVECNHHLDDDDDDGDDDDEKQMKEKAMDVHV